MGIADAFRVILSPVRSDGDETDQSGIFGDDQKGVAALAQGEELSVGVYGGRPFVRHRGGGVPTADHDGDGAHDGTHADLLFADFAVGGADGGAGVRQHRQARRCGHAGAHHRLCQRGGQPRHRV